MWIVDLDNAAFNFVELAWSEDSVNRYPEDDPQGRGGQFAPADYKKGTNYQGSGNNGGGDKNGSSSSNDKPSGKSSGPARFTDSNGDGKDDRQLSPAEMRKALAGLPKEMRDALAVYPSVLGAIKLAIENGEDPKKHLERLPSNLRAAAERAARSVANGGGSGSSRSPKDTGSLSTKEIADLRKAGWAGNGKAGNNKLYPPNHPDNAESNPGKQKKYRKGMSAREISSLPDDERMSIPASELPKPPKGYTWAEDRSLVSNSFYNSEGSQWFVDLAASDVTQDEMEKLQPLLEHYKGMQHPFTQCVADNRKRFGGRTEAVCAVVKDLVVGDTSWRGKSKEASEPIWSVDLDGAFFDFHGLAWQPDDVIELASGKKSKVSSLIRKLRADPRVDDPERLAGWIKHHRGSGKSSGSNGSSSSSDSDDSSSDSSGSSDSSSPKPEKPKGRMVSGFYIDDDDDPFADPFADDERDEPKTKEESEREKYEAKVLRELEREVPDKIYKTIMEFGGLKTRDDLREEYSEIPNTYKRKDGTNGDEMAEMLSMYYPQYGIETERDLIDFLAA